MDPAAEASVLDAIERRKILDQLNKAISQVPETNEFRVRLPDGRVCVRPTCAECIDLWYTVKKELETAAALLTAAVPIKRVWCLVNLSYLHSDHSPPFMPWTAADTDPDI